MNKYLKKFILRGMLFCWGGPLIVAIVWLCLSKYDVATDISLLQASISVISVTVLAFVVAGVTVIYEIESLPKVIAGLIQCLVLYISYLTVYLLNNWIDKSLVLLFTGIFITSFIVIWVIVYLLVNKNVNKLNKHIVKSN